MIKSALIFLGLIALSTSIHLHLQPGNLRDLNDQNFPMEIGNLQWGKKIIYFLSHAVYHIFIIVADK